jgi:hypothetical protein
MAPGTTTVVSTSLLAVIGFIGAPFYLKRQDASQEVPAHAEQQTGVQREPAVNTGQQLVVHTRPQILPGVPEKPRRRTSTKLSEEVVNSCESAFALEKRSLPSCEQSFHANDAERTQNEALFRGIFGNSFAHLLGFGLVCDIAVSILLFFCWRARRQRAGTEVETTEYQEEAVVAEADDRPGMYRILHDAAVGTQVSLHDGQDVNELREGDVVEVLEVVDCPEEHRLRGKVKHPASGVEGWISLLDTQSNVRWAAEFTPKPQKEDKIKEAEEFPSNDADRIATCMDAARSEEQQAEEDKAEEAFCSRTGDRVKMLETGQTGTIIEHRRSSIPFRVKFDDGQLLWRTEDSISKLEADSAMVPQTKLKELLANNPDIRRTKFVKNVPIAVYPLNAESLASMPSLILEGMGELDKATYPNKDSYLKSNFGGAMSLQVAHGKLDAYPIPADQYTSNYKVVSIEEMQTKNPKNATALSGILGDLNSIPGICGALKTVPTEMVLASDLGFPLENLLKIEAPWGGDQTKDAGKDAYLVVCDAPYLINLDELGLPVAYIMASDAQKVFSLLF